MGRCALPALWALVSVSSSHCAGSGSPEARVALVALVSLLPSSLRHGTRLPNHRCHKGFTAQCGELMTATTVTVITVITLTDHVLHSRLFHHAMAVATPVPGSDEPLRNMRCACGDEEGRAPGGEMKLREGN